MEKPVKALPNWVRYPLFQHNLKPLPYLDLKRHFREWRQFILPVFVLVGAILLIVLITVRTGNNSIVDPEKLVNPARIGLLSPKETFFDPAFAVASPIELAEAPKAVAFDFPVGSRHGALTYNAQPFLTSRHLGDDLNGIGGQNSDLGDPVFAISDGLCIEAGWPSDGWGNVVILLHELPNGQVIESFYGHLDQILIPVGKQVRRGDKIGTIGNADGLYLAHLHFELRTYPTIDAGAGYADSKMGRLSGELSLKKWRTREDNQLAAAPTGSPLPGKPMTFDTEARSAP